MCVCVCVCARACVVSIVGARGQLEETWLLPLCNSTNENTLYNRKIISHQTDFYRRKTHDMLCKLRLAQKNYGITVQPERSEAGQDRARGEAEAG